MSFPKKPSPVLFFTGVLFSKHIDVKELFGRLEKNYGAIMASSRLLPFVWSEYYNKEMGEDIKRIFIVFKEKRERDELVTLKKIADQIESEHVVEGKRTVNVDPGLITPENIVLATNKNFFHRVYLGDGVFAEITLFYKGGTYEHIVYWTFPEYRSSAVIEFFNEARSILCIS